MKNQDKAFVLKRDKVRNLLYMRRLDITGQCYRKLMGLKVNGEENRPLNESEVSDLKKSIDSAIETLNDFRNELQD